MEESIRDQLNLVDYSLAAWWYREPRFKLSPELSAERDRLEAEYERLSALLRAS